MQRVYSFIYYDVCPQYIFQGFEERCKLQEKHTPKKSQDWEKKIFFKYFIILTKNIFKKIENYCMQNKSKWIFISENIFISEEIGKKKPAISVNETK